MKLPQQPSPNFNRFYNIYFLLAAVFSFWPNASAISPTTQVVPLVFILFVTALKDGIEDYLRYVSDKKANNTPVELIRGTEALKTISRTIKAGDIVYVAKEELIPADLIILSTAFTDGTCFVETSQLDGETNLKRRSAVAETSNMTSIDKLGTLQARVQCEMPNNRLSTFEGRLILKGPDGQDQTIPLSAQNIGLRGARLRNTDFIFGICVYAGVDTKIFRNLSKTRLKFSTAETKLNRLLILVFLYNAIILVVSIIFGSNWALTYIGPDKSWYMWDGTSAETTAALQSMTYYILYTYVIPISLFVSMEIVRLIQAYFITVDEQLYMPNPAGIAKKAMVKNSNLNEDLGLIEYVFSDKTGTLTQNVMKLSRWYTAGTVFDEAKNPGSVKRALQDPSVDPNRKKELEFFVRHVALCHSAITSFDEKAKTYAYEAESPDESALLNSIRQNDIVVTERTKSNITIEYLGSKETYELLDLIEFNSDRKRMSVILKINGQITLLCKGADGIIFERIAKDSVQALAKKEMDQKLSDFSNLGLRTLVFAYRYLSQQEYDDFKRRYDEACASLQNREKQIMEVAEGVEKELLLLGCSAIEDKLQDNVPETIDFLLKCGIKVWVLTGDKTETAIKIALSCKLFQPQMHMMRLEAKAKSDVEKQIREVLADLDVRKDRNERNALVVNGDCLRHALEHFDQDFLKITQQCHAVVCCRVSPLQKAMVVKLVQKNLKKITLSIGDGANDVSMIQAAHVGVGIAGLEGAQAVRASDYAFTQFQCLKRLLVVHGRYSYYRLSRMIYFSLFKNLGFITVCFWFGIHSGWAGLQIYQETFLAMYNVIFTSLPPIGIGSLEKDVREVTIERYPAIYGTYKRAGFMNVGLAVEYLVFPFWHSSVLYFGLYGMMGEGQLSPNGYTAGYWMQGWMASSAVMLTVMLKVVLLQKHWTWLMAFLVAFSVFIYVLFMFVAEYLSDFGIPADSGAAVDASSVAGTYFYIIIAVFTCLLPDFSLKYAQSMYWPSDEDILREEYYLETKKRE